MTSDEDAGRTGLEEFIAQCHDAVRRQSQGEPETLLSLWSRAADVTVMAAIGGYQTGFDDVSALLTAASKTQAFDTWSAENLATIVDWALGCTIELEHYGKVGTDGITLRATQVYRIEDGRWRIIHRHGDILTAIEAKW
jgi:hypothetical protein